MRKEVLYSMLAALPAAAVPGMTFANTTQTVSNQQWTGGEFNTSDAVYVSNSGAPITISLGKKAPGSYTVKVKGISVKEGDLKVEVAGQSKTLSPNEQELQEVSIDFTLEAETDVTVKVTSVDNKPFSVGGDTEVTLNYDFSKANDLLTAELSKASNTIKNYTLANFDHSVWNRQEASLHSILDNFFKDGVAEAYENAYVKYRLWETIDLGNSAVKDNNQLLVDLKDAWKRSAQLYKDAVVNLYEGKQDSIKTAASYTGADQSVKDNVADELAAVQTAIDKLKGISLDGDLNNNHETFNADATAIDGAISTFTTALANETAAYTANEDAYNRVIKAADDAKGTYLVDLAKLLPDSTEAHLLAAGNKAIAKLFEELTAVKVKNDTSYVHKTAATDEAARNAEITDITSRLTATRDDYGVTLKQKLAGFEAQYNAVSAYPAQLKEQYTDSVVTSNADLLQKLNEAIQKVRTTIDGAQTGANADCQALKTLDLTEVLAGVETAKTNLENQSALDKARVDAEENAVAVIADLRAKLKAAEDSVATLKYADENAKDYDWRTSKSIGNDITSLETLVKNAKSRKYEASNAFYTATLLSRSNRLRNRIAEYLTDFSRAAENYNKVDTLVNNANTAIEAANNLVKNLIIYTDKSQNDGLYDYAEAYKTAKETITKVRTDQKNAKDEEFNRDGNTYRSDNTKAVIALQFDPATVDAFVAHVKNNYKNDSTAWQKAADAAALQAQKDAINTKWNELNTNWGGVVSTDTTKLATDKDEIVRMITELQPAIDSLGNDVTAAIAADNAATFADVVARLDKYTPEVDTLMEKIDASKAVFTANENAYKAVNTALTSLSWDGQKVKDAAGEAYTKPGENDEVARIDKLIEGIQKAYDAVNTSNNKYHGEFKSVDNKPSLVDSVADIKTRITAATDSAASMKRNWTNYQTLVAAHNGIAAVLSQAGNDAVAADPEAGLTYYKTVLIDSLYQGESDNILATIKANYKENKYSTDASQVQKSNNDAIKALIKKIQGVKAAVEKNRKQYADTTDPKLTSVQEKEAEVEKYWNTRMNELSTKDQSSKLADRQKEMNGYLDQLNKQGETDKIHYEGGLYGQYGKDGQETANKTYTDDLDALQAIYDKIKGCVDKAVNPDNYKLDIAADNANMLNQVKAERDKAQDAYAVAVKYVDTFKGLTSSQMQTILADPDVKTAYDAINNNVNPYATTIRDTYAEAEKKYGETTSPDIFDRDSSYVNAFRQLTAEITTNYDAFIAGVKTALDTNVKPDLTTWKESVDNALEAANRDYTWSKGRRTDYKQIFKPLQDNINAGLTIIEKDNVLASDFTELDNILNQLNGGKFAETLYADIDAAATSDVKDKLEAAEAVVTAANTGSTKIDDGTLDAFNQNDAAKVTQARQLYDAGKLYEDGNAGYTQIKTLIENFNAGNAYQTFNANNKAYKTAVDNLTARQTQLDEALADASKYACIETLKTQAGGFNAIQDEINQLKAEADAANVESPRNKTKLDEIATKAARYVNRGVVTYGKVGTEITDLVSQTGNLYDKEKAYIDERMKELVAEYNVWAADTTIADSTLAEQKATIEAIQTKIADIDNSRLRNPARTAANLQALEGTISENLDKLANLNGDLLATTRAALETSRQAVADKVTYGDADPEVQQNEAIAAEFAALQKDVEGKKDEIAQSHLFDKDRINAEIAALDKRADQLAQDIKAKDEAIKADKAAREAAKAQLQQYVAGLRTLVEAGKKDLDDTFSYTDSKSDKFTNKFDQISDDITAEETRINEYLAEGNDPREYTGNIESTVKHDLFEIKNLAAYRQLAHDLGTKDPGSYYYEAWNIVSKLNKTLFVQSDYEHITHSWAEIEGAYEEILGKISGEWQTGVSYDDGDDTNGINYVNREQEIDALKAKVDSLKAFYDKNVTTPDFNRDGVVDILDVIDIINHQDTQSSDDLRRYDTNNDGVVDILDIIKVINDQTSTNK